MKGSTLALAAWLCYLPALAFSGTSSVSATSQTLSLSAASPVSSLAKSLTQTAAQGLSSSVQVLAVSAAVQPPRAPTALTALFLFVTHTAKAAVATVRLRWEPSRQTDFLLASYQMKVFTGNTPTAKVFKIPADQSQWEDQGVNVTLARHYKLLAVDSAGNSSLATPLLTLPLDTLSEKILSPLPVSGFVALSRRNDIELKWAASQAMAAPISHYRIYRARRADKLWQAKPWVSLKTGLRDTKIEKKVDYVYGIEVVDKAGRVSPHSLTRRARATGTLPPLAPGGLTVTASVEKILLQWEKAEAGTSRVSRYHIVRIDPLRQGRKREKILKPKKPLDLRLSDGGVDGGVDYIYKIYALDVEGNTSLAAVTRARPQIKPRDWSSVFIMPTAFSNNEEKGLAGWNLNILFDFYVGALYETFENPFLQRTTSGVFQRIQVGTFSGDLKYSLWKENRYFPSIATGFYGVSLLTLGQPSAGGGGTTVRASSTGDNSFETFGGLYASMSKRLWGNASIHAGYIRGNLGGELGKIAPNDWKNTLQHLSPSSNMPQLIGRLVDPSLGVPIDTPPDLMYTSLKLPFTIPGWGKHTALELEAMTPVPDERGTERLPVMVSVGLEDIQTFGFEFAYVKFFGGYEVLAYYHFKDLSWSW